MSEPASRYLELRGLNFHYLDFGGGDLPPAVFLHGTGMHAWLWLPFAEALRGQFHVYALDQRGHGDSSKVAESYVWSELALDLLEFIEALNLRKPLCIGHSMGGAVVVIAEGLRAGAVGRMFLIDPIIMGEEYYGERFKTIEDDSMSVRTLRRRGVWESCERMIDSYSKKPPFNTWAPEQLELYVRHGTEPLPDDTVRLKCMPEIEARTYFGGHHADPWPFVPRVESPAAVLAATAGDMYMMTKSHELARMMKRGELVEIPGATHFAPMEAPDLVIRRIQDFAARSETAGAAGRR